MTAVVACRVNGRVLVGADRCWSGGAVVTTCGPKVMRAGRWWIATAGTLECDWEGLADEDPASVAEWSEILGSCDAEVLLIKGRRIRYGSCQLNRKWLWGVVYGDIAIGSGGAQGLAAWDALHAYETDPVKRMRVALKAAAKRAIDVSGPFDVVWT